MKQEPGKKRLPGGLAFAGAASVALLAAGLWSALSGSTAVTSRTGGEPQEQEAPAGKLATSGGEPAPRLLPVRPWKPGDTFVYDIRSERLIGVDTSKVASARNAR
jgi:hypothetical protein